MSVVTAYDFYVRKFRKQKGSSLSERGRLSNVLCYGIPSCCRGLIIRHLLELRSYWEYSVFASDFIWGGGGARRKGVLNPLYDAVPIASYNVDEKIIIK